VAKRAAREIAVQSAMTDVRANAPREVRLAVSTLDAAALQPYCVPGTPAERIAMVWPLTVEVLAFSGKFDAQSRLSRSVVRVRELAG